MDNHFEALVNELYAKSNTIASTFLEARHIDANTKLTIPEEFKSAFFRLVDKVNLSLMEDTDNFYGYFLLQMSRELRFDISSPTAVNFKGAKFVIYFNPLIFLNLNIKQMESSIKHEILHILSLHLIRAKDFKTGYSTLAVNLAMNIVVNTYLDHLPPYSVTLEWVNLNYSLKLLPFEPFEYYVEKIQAAIDLLAAGTEEAAADNEDKQIETVYDPEKTHAIWEDSSETDEKTLKEFTEKVIAHSHKGSIPGYVESMLSALKRSNGELPWNLYLKRLMGTIASNKKKTITRRNRRQPERLDLRGQLRSHKAKIVVALDISGSISDEEFNAAIKEVFAIVKNYHHEITIVECDNEIKRVYKASSVNDVKERSNVRGGTRFTPVFEYANSNKANLLVYFTDGKGEDRLSSRPSGYKTLWVLSGKGDKLSLTEAYGTVKRLKHIEIRDHSLDLNEVRFRDGYSMNDQEKIHI